MTATAPITITDRQSPSRGEKLAACVRNMEESEGVPPFSQHAAELITRTLDLETSSNQLAQIILKDVGLTSQLLRVANSALYNRWHRPIVSVAHAVMLMGCDSIRNLVSAVRYVEHFASRSPALRELMLMSVLTGLHCRDVAWAVGYPQPEEAYLRGLFRNFGEVLLACYNPEEYARIVLKMHDENMTERASCLSVLGFTWDELADRVAAAWNMPANSANETGHVRGSKMEACLNSVSDYAHALTHAEYRKAAGIEAVVLNTVVDPLGRGAVISSSEIRRILKHSLREAQQLFAGLQIPADRLRLSRQAELARNVLYSTPVFTPGHSKDVESALEKIAAEMRRDPDFELTRVITSVLDQLIAAGFDRAVFALVNENHTLLRGRIMAGIDGDELLKRFHFRIERTEGPVYAAMQHRVDVLVERTRDDRYDTCLMVSVMQPSAFALFPIVVNQKVVGCLYADRKSHTPGLDAIKPALVRARTVVAEAIGRKAPGRD